MDCSWLKLVTNECEKVCGDAVDENFRRRLYDAVLASRGYTKLHNEFCRFYYVPDLQRKVRAKVAELVTDVFNMLQANTR